MSDIKPFTINVPQEKLDLVKKKLELATFPDELEDSGWDLGTPLSEIQRLTSYWLNTFSWRNAEARLNKLPQFTTPIEVEGFGTINLHFVHQKCQVPDVKAIPLIFVHGWPGSFMEVEKLLPLLTKGDQGPYFDVVAPSLAGYAWSDGAKKRGFGPKQQAQLFHKLMLKLGYNEYVTQGGDWGSSINRWLAHQFGPTHVKASHFNYIPMAAAPSLKNNPILAFQHSVTPYTDSEKHLLERTDWFKTEGYGYNVEQSTKPQTLGYALHDSPVGLLAWIREKLHDWTDQVDQPYQWTDDEILTWIGIYAYSPAGPTAAHRIYYNNMHQDEKDREWWLKPIPSSIPIGVSVFPWDLTMFPKTWYHTQGNLVYHTVHKSGGHFAAHEQPDVLAKDLREMFGKEGGAAGIVAGKSGYKD